MALCGVLCSKQCSWKDESEVRTQQQHRCWSILVVDTGEEDESCSW